MLENTVWRQYNQENNYAEFLSKYTSIDIIDMIEDEKELYAIMKSKLTKKELKLFAMDCAGVDDSAIMKEFAYSQEELEKAKFKLYKKFKQDKTRLSFRAI